MSVNFTEVRIENLVKSIVFFTKRTQIRIASGKFIMKISKDNKYKNFRAPGGTTEKNKCYQDDCAEEHRRHRLLQAICFQVLKIELNCQLLSGDSHCVRSCSILNRQHRMLLNLLNESISMNPMDDSLRRKTDD